jgi:G:T/U-mismatch repair DNA glycosylase
MSVTPGLRDILAPNLRVVFCGINPGLKSAVLGHHFTGRSNRFWKTIHLAGFTSEEIAPENGELILSYRCGLTTAVARPTSRADELSCDEFTRAASALSAKIAHYSPRYVAFLAKGRLLRDFRYEARRVGQTRRPDWRLNDLGPPQPQRPQPLLQPGSTRSRLHRASRCRFAEVATPTS